MQFTGGNGPTFGVTHRMTCNTFMFSITFLENLFIMNKEERDHHNNRESRKTLCELENFCQQNYHWGTPELSQYSCKDFPSRTIQTCLLLRKDKIRPNTWPEISYHLSLWKRLAYQTLQKSEICQLLQLW